MLARRFALRRLPILKNILKELFLTDRIIAPEHGFVNRQLKIIEKYFRTVPASSRSVIAAAGIG
jgi:hypothetical protein